MFLIIDFPSDIPEEYEEADELLMFVGEMIEEEEMKTAIIVPEKYEQIRFVYAVMKYLTKDTDAEVSCRLNEPFKSMGSVSVETEEITFTNTEWFARAAGYASNLDIYPLVNGKIRIDFTFHHITTPIE